MSEFTQDSDRMLPTEQMQSLEILPSQPAPTSEADRLYSLLTDYNFIEAKLSASGVQPLIEEYDLATKSENLTSNHKSETLKLIQQTLRLSAHIISKDKTQLPTQLSPA